MRVEIALVISLIRSSAEREAHPPSDSSLSALILFFLSRYARISFWSGARSYSTEWRALNNDSDLGGLAYKEVWLILLLCHKLFGTKLRRHYGQY